MSARKQRRSAASRALARDHRDRAVPLHISRGEIRIARVTETDATRYGSYGQSRSVLMSDERMRLYPENERSSVPRCSALSGAFRVVPK
jgi:hypothetical protein